jgi:hypothetical protein
MRDTVAVVSVRRSISSAGLFAAMLALLIAGPVGAQVSGRSLAADLRLEWSVEEDRRGRPVVSGYIYNDRAGSYASGVRLRVEALDAAGQPVGSTTGYVMGDVPPSNQSYFEIKAPAGAASYRVTIQSYTWRGYGAGGG